MGKKRLVRGKVSNMLLGGIVIGLLVGLPLGYFAAPERIEYVTRSLSSPSGDERAELNRDNLLIRFNEQRLANGLNQVGTEKDLEDAAQERADSLESAGACTHSGLEAYLPRLQKPSQRLAGGELLTCGERNSTAAVRMLSESPSHRDVMLDDNLYSVGFGISDDTVVVFVRIQK